MTSQLVLEGCFRKIDAEVVCCTTKIASILGAIAARPLLHVCATVTIKSANIGPVCGLLARWGELEVNVIEFKRSEN